MLDGFYADLSIWIHGLGWIGLVILLILAFFHVTLEGPLALFLLATTTLLLDSFGWALVILLLVHWAGLPLFYLLVHHFHEPSHQLIDRVHVTRQILEWVDHQHRWQHMVVIGLPFIITYPLKLAFTLRTTSFKDYMVTLMGSYVILYLGHSLIYWGILSLLTTQYPWWVGVLASLGVVILIYWGRHLIPSSKAST